MSPSPLSAPRSASSRNDLLVVQGGVVLGSEARVRQGEQERDQVVDLSLAQVQRLDAAIEIRVGLTALL
jgi:hypothetical protein